MRVLHVIPSISARRGGPSFAVLEMVQALRQRGVDASILTTNDDGKNTDSSLPSGQWVEREGIPVLAFSRWSPSLQVIREFAFSPGLNNWLAKYIRNFDLIHVHALFSWPSTSAMAQARYAATPYVVSTIGQLNHWSLKQSTKRKRAFLKLIEYQNLGHAKALHFTTEEEKRQAKDLGLTTPGWVIPLGVKAPSMPLTVDEKKPRETPVSFLFLSRIHPKKQLDHLLRAFGWLKENKSCLSWQLQIAGDGDSEYIKELQDLAAQMKITSDCNWMGFLEGNNKWETLRSADWFVLPSASENFCIAAVESLAVGTPTILTEEVALAPIINAAGAGMICRCDPLQLAESLEQAIISRPGLEMRTAAMNLAAQSFSWPAIAYQLEQAYTSVTESM